MTDIEKLQECIQYLKNWVEYGPYEKPEEFLKRLHETEVVEDEEDLF